MANPSVRRCNSRLHIGVGMGCCSVCTANRLLNTRSSLVVASFVLLFPQVEGTKLKLHSNLTRYIQEHNRRNLKMKIHRQLLDRLNAASEMVHSATQRRTLAARQASSGASGTPGRGRRGSLIEDEFPSGIKHRGNRRRIDPRVALNHIFEGIYKVNRPRRSQITAWFIIASHTLKQISVA